MRKIVIIAAIAISSFAASAQEFFTGGSLGYWHDGTADTDEFTIMPELGYNINSNWAVAGSIGYTFVGTDGTDTHLFSFNPYARYTYFRSSNNLVTLFVDGGFGIGTGKTNYDEGGSSDTATTWNIGFKPGLALNFTDKFSFVAHFGFLGYEGANDAAEASGLHKGGGFDFSSQNLTFGFYYNF